ncbi:hypothetical protein DUNSADRAFT_1564 [Dunaliella salina]|uniref:Uncharacterized protein n=1 Tax=Dunaliella salina TaxID=3046 RepID=A0ABQ7FXB2_DUNSA|nr:hypothetical protein DUNSADRAFT_1564 [Dunaliella salina]|eukprot:KAF5826973.1 hypothetical protein DUNSADRAFT_1564 [Dunaliella salina]
MQCVLLVLVSEMIIISPALSFFVNIEYSRQCTLVQMMCSYDLLARSLVIEQQALLPIFASFSCLFTILDFRSVIDSASKKFVASYAFYVLYQC